MKKQHQNMEVFDRALLRQRRDRAAPHINDFDFLLREVAQRLSERLDVVKKNLPVAVDLGGGHGVMADVLSRRKGTELVVSTDLSFGMAAQSPVAAVVADEECLPFAGQSLDAVVANLSLHWVNDLPGALSQIRRALKVDGLFMAAVLGGQSLSELREALMQAEMDCKGGASPRVSPFISMQDMGALMQRAGFTLPVIDSDIITVDYASPFSLMHDLRGMGAANATFNRLLKPTSRKVMMEAAIAYQEKHASPEGTVPATFEIIYAVGWAPHETQQQPLKPGTAKVRLADALKTEEKDLDDAASP